MAEDAPLVGNDGSWALGTTAFAKDQTGLQIREIEVAKLLDRDCLMVELPFLGGILALRDAPQKHLRFLASKLGRPHAMQSNREPARPPEGAILEDRKSTRLNSSH